MSDLEASQVVGLLVKVKGGGSYFLSLWNINNMRSFLGGPLDFRSFITSELSM